MRHTVSLLPFVLIAAVAGCGRGPTDAASAQPAPPPLPSSPAAAAVVAGPQQSSSATGSVLETMNAAGYTYLRLKTDTGEIWAAATEFPVKVGDKLTVSLDMPMNNYHSRTLNRDFPLIYFVSAVARDGQPLPAVLAGDAAAGASSAGAASQSPHGMTAPATTMAVTERIAPPAGGMSIADAIAKRKSLSGKSVTVRGKVVKVNNGIMGRNWLHLQDGSGVAAEHTNDLTITTLDAVNVGDVVTITGVLGVDKDFGAGYAYDAILEDAKIATR